MTSVFSKEALAHRLFQAYEKYREPRLSHRRFKQNDLLPLLKSASRQHFWEIKAVGHSFEGREIVLLQAGTGAIRVLLWSQMHGDEATATMAFLDLFNFFEEKNDGFDDFRASLLSEVTLYFVPMLNPDGAERFQRATAQMIDMNRDALALQTPEARVLKKLVDDIQPDFGFNLHDQNPRYTAGKSPKLATVSFLATSYDYELSVNATRLRSMQLIAHLNNLLQEFIPGQVGRFSDDHEPRAFGDNIQKWGVSLVLLESGGYPGDTEKQFVRKLNFVALLSAFGAIVDQTYTNRTQDDYEKIPQNQRSAYDLVIRNVSIRCNEHEFSVDLGINREEVNNQEATGFYYQSIIEEVGDLRTCYGIQEFPASHLHIQPVGIYPHVIAHPNDWAQLDVWDLARTGYGYLRVTSDVKQALLTHGKGTFPVWIGNENEPFSHELPKPGELAHFFLYDGDQQPAYSVINGFIFDLKHERIV